MVSDGVEIANGAWHPPGAAAAIPATLLANGSELLVRTSDDGLVRTVSSLPLITITDRIGRVPRRITFADNSTFETKDNEAVDLYLKAHRADRTGWIHELEKIHPRLIVFVVLVMLISGLIYRFALPVLVETAVWVTPPIVPEVMSASTLVTLDRTVFSPSTLPAGEQAKIRSAFDALAAYSTRGPSIYHLNFREGGAMGPNALALPDGTLVITDELVRMAGGDTEMILGVLAHEIGHVEKQHALRQLYRAAGTAGLIMLVAGDVGSGGHEVLTDGAALVSLSYSRSVEAEADRVSVELMLKAGHDPRAIGRFFKLLEDKLGDHSGTSMLSTHPGTPERRQAIDDYATQLEDAKIAK